MVHGRHLEHAQAIGEGSAADFVGALQGVFAATRKIVLESPGVRPLEIACLTCLNVLTHIHWPSRKYRATSTRASSVVLPCRARMFSAAFRGGWFRANRRSKSVWTPSVVKMSVSSVDTGITDAWSVGI